MSYESEGVKPISRKVARKLLDEAGMPEQVLPRMGYLVPLDKCHERWIENRSGRLELVTFSKLIKPAWLDPVIPRCQVGQYLRRQGGYQNVP